jgi:hypothetical protein
LEAFPPKCFVIHLFIPVDLLFRLLFVDHPTAKLASPEAPRFPPADETPVCQLIPSQPFGRVFGRLSTMACHQWFSVFLNFLLKLSKNLG